jgi:hypothetical protein
MSDQNNRGTDIFLSALIGGLAGGLVVYLSDDKRRKMIKGKFDDLMEEGQERSQEFKDAIQDSLKKGRKNIAKKLREAEEKLEA